jgi:NAD(P)-dependent dehydrogenase (short-subunit alcohol dehydrogenase family)
VTGSTESRFGGAVALVTGAGSGIGAAVARALSRDGARVVVTDLDLAQAQHVAGAISAGGGQAVPLALDVGDEDAVDRSVALAYQTYGPPTVLINNAAATDLSGSGRDADVLSMETAVWDRTMAVNLRGAMLLCRAVLPGMLAAGKGAVINTSSGGAAAAEHTRPAYAASKAGLEALTRSVAAVYGPQGVRCNAVAPGLTLTETVAGPGRGLEKLRTVFARHTPSPLGTADDVANVVSFLASDEARYVNGVVLRVDGGLLASQPYLADFLKR